MATTELMKLFSVAERLEAVEVADSGSISASRNRLISKSANYTINTADFSIGGELIVLCTNTTAITQTLPTALKGYNATTEETALITIKKSDGAVTVATQGGETIDGLPSASIARKDAITFFSDGVNWWIK